MTPGIDSGPELENAGHKAAAGASTAENGTGAGDKAVFWIRANQGHSLEVTLLPSLILWLFETLTGFSGLCLFQVEDLDLTDVKDASEIPVVIHGTYKKNWPSIGEVRESLFVLVLELTTRSIETAKTGLSKMTRNHIHCASGMLGSDGVIRCVLRPLHRFYSFLIPISSSHSIRRESAAE